MGAGHDHDTKVVETFAVPGRARGTVGFTHVFRNVDRAFYLRLRGSDATASTPGATPCWTCSATTTRGRTSGSTRTRWFGAVCPSVEGPAAHTDHVWLSALDERGLDADVVTTGGGDTGPYRGWGTHRPPGPPWPRSPAPPRTGRPPSSCRPSRMAPRVGPTTSPASRARGCSHSTQWVPATASPAAAPHQHPTCRSLTPISPHRHPSPRPTRTQGWLRSRA